MSEQAPVDFRS